MKYEVTAELVITSRVAVIVEAADKEAAIDAAHELLPKGTSDSAHWNAEIKITRPKGAPIRSVKPFHFQTAGGSEKVRLVRTPTGRPA